MGKLKFDFHTHHERCGHATGTIREYIEAAIAKGFDMIGISDHSPHFYSSEDRLSPKTMAKSEFASYVDEVLHLKEVYKHKIDVLLGVESDYFAGDRKSTCLNSSQVSSSDNIFCLQER